ncbi:MAG: GNAT family N-acetyltransferase [Phycisphaerales bacterium]|jgi:L-amino acid N-acyltransferase YncA|nr:GNAT family N-acetyltransferase [Phycisphaerales bacterium]
MQIRLMTNDDAPDIANVLNIAIGGSIAHFGTVPTSCDEVLEDWYNSSETYPWLVARTDDGKFIGFAKGSAWKTRKAYRWTVESGIYLAAESQGMGAGKKLYTKLFEILTLQGYRIVLAGVSLPNDASVGLHESLGMSIAGDIDPAGFKLGEWIPVRLYQKQLGDTNKGSVPGNIRAVTSVWEELQNE